MPEITLLSISRARWGLLAAYAARGTRFFEIWFAIMKRKQEAHCVVVEPCKEIRRHLLSRGFQVIEAGGLCHHSPALRGRA
ncbi:hypothetical protein DSM25558_1398 [Agrobacterium sp. DSM 25558]|uniref:Uncharacterized protein n=1 Tax=Agrobacterium rosae TaxID=1972867 RepID=A0A1R3TMR5_9HYPH|nr:hypothetical protein DSM25558_1398 [Agrobacterium sp. DSM 25558]SCX22907.1 hypothetical protein DSM25559_2290 [Agrobacterium rosae]